ncbi:MAG TPA: SIMPL domain-containing protein [Methanoregulaceae archaeon]|nr:SIMPL domain-containing protein [Methanoregulaceae archaeon]HOV67828.1 SIMPL domain-containing protein [Methanoregulaceae archaeon]HQJ88081.1 SIMPL domain-containing protein [Methanoregulaceae archaeon]
MKNAVLRVQGRGEARAEPDLVVLSFQVEAWSMDYAETLEGISRSVEDLRDVLGAQGIPRTALKTVGFGVETRYRTAKKTGKPIFQGYDANHALRLELDRSQDVGAVLRAISKKAPAVEVRLSFEVRDRRGFRQRLLAAAVEAARENAETIARESGVRLGPVLEIEYGWTEVRYSSPFDYRTVSFSPSEAPVPSFEPAEVRGTESVTVTWAIGSAEVPAG